MPAEGWITVIAGLIALGLILKFGGSSNALTGTFFSGLTGETNSLLMSNNPGNLPPNVKSA